MDLTDERFLHLCLADDGEPRITPKLLARLRADLERPGRVVVLEGGEGCFNEGLDLRFLEAEAEVRGGGSAFGDLLEALARTPRPVVALVDGPALGAGCALAAVADLVLATPRATFGLPEVLWGLIPAVALRHVARRVGVPRARLLALGAPALDAAEAHRWGLVDAVVPALAPALAAHAKRFFRADARALGEVKALASLLQEDEGYEGRALVRFGELARSGTARARVARFESGGVPWGDDA